MEKGSDREMTLGFELSAFERCANPHAVLEDARKWSRYVGLVANDTDAVTSYVQDHDLQQDFELGDRDKWLALAEVRQETNTPRHVFIGHTTDSRMAAEHTGWEFISIDEAAEKAGWEIETHSNQEPGIIDRLQTLIQTKSLHPGKDQ